MQQLHRQPEKAILGTKRPHHHLLFRWCPYCQYSSSLWHSVSIMQAMCTRMCERSGEYCGMRLIMAYALHTQSMTCTRQCGERDGAWMFPDKYSLKLHTVKQHTEVSLLSKIVVFAAAAAAKRFSPRDARTEREHAHPSSVVRPSPPMSFGPWGLPRSTMGTAAAQSTRRMSCLPTSRLNWTQNMKNTQKRHW